jgi:hypothetical protein
VRSVYYVGPNIHACAWIGNMRISLVAHQGTGVAWESERGGGTHPSPPMIITFWPVEVLAVSGSTTARTGAHA